MSLKRKASDSSDELSWRMACADSFADWTIEVSNKETEQTKEYHVHRAILAIGPRRSEYFAGVFRSKGLQESNERVTRLEFSSNEAEAFPFLLDYVYDGNLNVRVNIAVALFKISEYFIIAIPKEQIKRDVRNDVRYFDHRGGEQLAFLYKEAVALGIDEMLDFIADFLMYPLMLEAMFEVIDPAFFLRVSFYYPAPALFAFLAKRTRDIGQDMFWRLAIYVFVDLKAVPNIQFFLELLELAEENPKVEQGVPVCIQKLFAHFVEGLGKAICRRILERKTPLKDDFRNMFFDGLNAALKIPNLDRKVESSLQGIVMKIFGDHCPFSAKGISEEHVACLHKLLTCEQYANITDGIASLSKSERIRE